VAAGGRACSLTMGFSVELPAQVRIGQMDYFLGSPALGKREANLGEPRTRVRSGRGRGGVNGYSDSAADLAIKSATHGWN
jgi:hypothetical protein